MPRWRPALALAVALLLVIASPVTAEPDRTTGSQGDFATELAAAINQYRASLGQPPLAVAPSFTLLATQHSQAMIAGGFFSHTAPNGVTFAQRVGGFVGREGYKEWHITESLAASIGTPDPLAVLQEWIESPPHHANLVDPRVQTIGIGTAHADVGTGFWAGRTDVTAITAIFGPPQPKLRESVLVTRVRGTVLVRPPGERRLRPVKDTELVRAGTEVDVAGGRVRLTSAADTEGRVQTADFYEGRFVLGYLDDFPGTTPPGGVVTDLRLTGPLSCPPRRRSLAAAAAQKPPPKKRRLWGNGSGKFRTTAKFASATVRGTIWLTEDTCGTTLVRVRQGTVDVYDAKRRTHVLVPAGKSAIVKG